MSSKNKTIIKKHYLVAWQDSDVPDMIKDRSFAGRLATATSNKENHQPNKEIGDLLLKTDKELKKRRVSKRPSIAASAASTAAINELNLDQLSMSAEAVVASNQRQALAAAANRVGAHFVFGNQTADGGVMSSKTSNNKLEQSHRISYHEMCTVLNAQRAGIVEQTIESLNRCYEEKYFSEWLRLMRCV